MSARTQSLFDFDRNLGKGISAKGGAFCLMGVDEAGRGPWAGPVVAAAAVISPNVFIPGLNDSKQVSPQQRSKLFHLLRTQCRWAAGIVSPQTIDEINILQATRAAMKLAVETLLRLHPTLKPDLVIVDGNRLPSITLPSQAIVDGDAKSASIAAASIFAKTLRDRIMAVFDRQYPGYGFAGHKGYGTARHQESLNRLGPCAIHRKSFAPVRVLLDSPKPSHAIFVQN